MHIAILIVAIVLVGTGIFMRTRTEDRILGESVPTQTPSPTSMPSPSNTSAPTQKSSNLRQFLYPDATISLQSDNSLTLVSSDDAQTITDWYKNKINELGMNTRSFVQTKTNDNLHNVLAAAKSGEEIKVTITKNAGDSQVSIVISRSSY